MREVKVKTVKTLFSTDQVLLESVSQVYLAYQQENELKGYFTQEEAEQLRIFHDKAKDIVETDDFAFLFPVSGQGITILPIVKKEDLDEDKLYFPVNLQLDGKTGEVEEIVLEAVEVR